MIVDTSALFAVLTEEDEHETILAALVSEPSFLPSPVRVEFDRVASGRRVNLRKRAALMLESLEAKKMQCVPLTEWQSRLAVLANAEFGTGNGRGGTLNMLDLMVYAVSKDTERPLLCTGRDFAATDLDLHPASRPY
ncbi:MAG: type II toxin-antitoxin system VapC family toxin [Pseudomonadota bacterium]